MVFITWAGCSSPSKESGDSDLRAVDYNNVNVELINLKGQPVSLSQFKGKTVFVNFWATWCKPCIAEMPSIEKAQEILKDKPVVFLLVSNEPKERIEKFRQSHNFNFEYLQITSPLEDLGIMALPTTHIISPEGNTVYAEMGARPWDTPENLDLILSNTEERKI